MSSASQSNVLGSTVFQQTLRSCGLFVVVSLAVLWAVTWFFVRTSDQAQDAGIAESIAWAEDLYYGEGIEALVLEAIIDETEILWSEDLIYEALEEEWQLWVLRDANYEPIAGYYGLHGDFGWQTTQLEHPEIDQPVRVLTVELRGGTRLSVAEFLPDDRAELLSFSQFATWALLLIVLPLALITGFALSNRVFKRIEGISQTAAAVGSGQMAQRATLSPRHDEFDRLAGNINQMLDEVEALNSNIEAVSVGVAHDLRTPLTNIGGRLELIRRDKSNPEAIETHLDAADAAQEQLMRVFDALLRLGEVKAGRRKAAFADVDFSALVQGMSEAFEPVFADADKTFQAAVAANVSLRGDRELLEQLMANLLENALEHSRDAAQVFVTLRADEGVVALTVGDDGPGISPADRDQIFDRFYRADRSRSSPGNGLGLSLVEAIADLHGAQITLDPDAKGAVFSVVFQGTV